MAAGGGPGGGGVADVGEILSKGVGSTAGGPADAGAVDAGVGDGGVIAELEDPVDGETAGGGTEGELWTEGGTTPAVTAGTVAPDAGSFGAATGVEDLAEIAGACDAAPEAAAPDLDAVDFWLPAGGAVGFAGADFAGAGDLAEEEGVSVVLAGAEPDVSGVVADCTATD